MVRFKVVKGSQLLMAAAVVVLALVVGGIVLATVLSDSDPAVGAQASLVRQEEEAKTETVFASSLSVLPLDPSDAPLRIEVVPECTPAAGTRSILIYHTHTHEAYEQAADDQYVAIEAWRTMDEDHSVVRVGEELARLLRERGFEVVHDTTDHEQNDLVCLLRRVKRDIRDRGRSVESIYRQYLESVKPMYEKYIRNYVEHADLIVARGGKNARIVDILAHYINSGMIQSAEQ